MLKANLFCSIVSLVLKDSDFIESMLIWQESERAKEREYGGKWKEESYKEKKGKE